MKLLKAIPVLLWTITVFAQATNPAQLQEDLHKYLSVLHANQSFSGEILVAKKDSIIFWGPIGLASVENNIPIKTRANYRIASISKTFTATLIGLAQATFDQLNLSNCLTY